MLIASILGRSSRVDLLGPRAGSAECPVRRLPAAATNLPGAGRPAACLGCRRGGTRWGRHGLGLPRGRCGEEPEDRGPHPLQQVAAGSPGRLLSSPPGGARRSRKEWPAWFWCSRADGQTQRRDPARLFAHAWSSESAVSFPGSPLLRLPLDAPRSPVSPPSPSLPAVVASRRL